MNACSIWLPLMCFCKVNNLPYTIKYLQICAESNQWLMYLLFAQMYQIPRYQVIDKKLFSNFLEQFEYISLKVISCLEYFTDIGLKQHLEYALHNVITSSTTASASSIANSESSQVSLSLKLKNKFSSVISASNWFKQRNTKSGKKNKLSKNKSIEKNNGTFFLLGFIFESWP